MFKGSLLVQPASSRAITVQLVHADASWSSAMAAGIWGALDTCRGSASLGIP